jgi:hypothetical protein
MGCTFAPKVEAQERTMTTNSRLPVVDGDEGADVYGYANSAEEARAIAEGCFADPIAKVERYGPVHLSDGRTLPEAFVAFTQSPIAEQVQGIRSDLREILK